MDYRIEKKDAFKLICKIQRVKAPEGEPATADVSAFWSKCDSDGTVQALCKYGKFDQYHGVLGVCFSSEMADNGFPYGIGVEYNGAPLSDEGFDIVDIPAQTYAVFACRGKMPDAFKETYQKIWTEFFPQSNYKYFSGVELEVYPTANTNDPNFFCEIWIAVEEKL